MVSALKAVGADTAGVRKDLGELASKMDIQAFGRLIGLFRKSIDHTGRLNGRIDELLARLDRHEAAYKKFELQIGRAVSKHTGMLNYCYRVVKSDGVQGIANLPDVKALDEDNPYLQKTANGAQDQGF